MRILLYNDNYDEIGGVETYFRLLPDGLRKLGREVYIFSFAEEKKISKYEYIYKKPKKNLLSRVFSSFVFDFKVYSLFNKCIKEVKPEIIHINHNSDYTNSILYALKKNKIPVLQSLHDYTIICPLGSCIDNKNMECHGTFSIKCIRCLPFVHFLVYAIFFQYKVKFTRKVIKSFATGSKKFIDKLRKHNFYNVYWLPYFVDSSYQKKVKKIKKEENTILFVGRFREEKGAQYLIEAMPLILKKIPKAKLIMVGEGIIENFLKKRVRELGISANVNFLGRVQFNDVQELYKRATVIAVPSVWTEQFGKVGIEAMQYGTPVVGSDIGGIPEWLHHNKNGFLVSPRNSKKLAQVIIKVLADKKLRKRFGKYAKKLVKEEYSYDLHFKLLELCYKNVINFYKK